MHQIIQVHPIHHNRGYSILIGQSFLDGGAWLTQKKWSQIVIVTDDVIQKLYAFSLQKYLSQQGYSVLLFSFAAGEKSKNNKTKQAIEQAMFKNGCDRDTLILALGGGVVGDLAGFIASTFLRGISYIQIPTSLLAMVDSSIGGKTGINTSYGKNLIGCIYQPFCVVIDTALLKTLPRNHLINGLIECIKMFLTHDADSFQYTESHLESIIQGRESFLNEMIVRAIRIKAAVVTRDERDQGERNTLNFGHTIGHALEKLSHYELLHGYAVGYGMLVEAMISHLLGQLDVKEFITIRHLMASLGIHSKDLRKYNIDALIQATRIDKKCRAGHVHYVLLNRIGHVNASHHQFVHPVPDDIVKRAFENLIEA